MPASYTSPVQEGLPLRAMVRSAKERLGSLFAPRSVAGDLVARNRASYLAAMRAHATQLGVAPPSALTDRAVLAGIRARAQDSADSILQTRADRKEALERLYGDHPQARAAYRDWERQQDAMIRAYEASRARAEAYHDLLEHNKGKLAGMEWIEPDTTAGLDDACDHALAKRTAAPGRH